MDGFEASRQINRLDWSLRQRPKIIALTASASQSDKIACLQAGMDFFLSKKFFVHSLNITAKPLRVEDIRDMCERVVKVKKQKSFPVQ